MEFYFAERILVIKPVISFSWRKLRLCSSFKEISFADSYDHLSWLMFQCSFYYIVPVLWMAGGMGVGWWWRDRFIVLAAFFLNENYKLRSSYKFLGEGSIFVFCLCDINYKRWLHDNQREVSKLMQQNGLISRPLVYSGYWW